MTGDTTPISDEARKAAAKALLDEGGGPGNSFHSWRCEYPDRYGPCDCVQEVADSILAVAAPLLVSAEAERLQAELDRIANIPIIAYTLDLEAQIERRRLDLGAIQDLTRADRPYDWRLEQIQQIAREGLSR